MSSKKSIDSDSVRQDEIDEINETPEFDPAQDDQAELIRQQCQFYRNLNAMLNPSAENVGRRLGQMSEGGFLPASASFVSVPMLAGLLNLSTRAVQEQVSEGKVAKFGFGRSVYFSLLNFLRPRSK